MLSVAERLLALQQVDTEADQLARRRQQLPERAELAARTEALRSWERARGELRARLDALAATVDRAEDGAAALRDDRRRLEAQLKTVIAPREAEALMREIEALDERRDILETEELEALEEQARLDDDLSAHLGDEPALRAAMGYADDALATAAGEIDDQLAVLEHQRSEHRAALGEDLLGHYDRVRAQQGVAVAALAGTRCEGCHLDLSAAEVADVRDAAADAPTPGLADCPQCGRLLVVPT